MKIDNSVFVLPISNAAPIPKVEIGTDETQESPGAHGFAQAFRESWEAGAEASDESRRLAAEMVTGQLEDMPEYMVAGERSTALFELNLTLRNKVLDAYSEIMKTPM